LIPLPECHILQETKSREANTKFRPRFSLGREENRQKTLFGTSHQ